MYREEIKGHDAWENFFEYNDIALPMSYLIAAGLVLPNGEDSESFIDETWEMFCEYIDIDPEKEYVSIADAFGASDNPPIV